MKEIYLVEKYHHDYMNEDEIRIPLIAFTNIKDAQDYADLCTNETKRIQTKLKEYWKKHEDQERESATRLRIALHTGTYEIGCPDEVKRNEIFEGAKAIEESHKYHPHLTIWESMNVDYKITVIELRS